MAIGDVELLAGKIIPRLTSSSNISVAVCRGGIVSSSPPEIEQIIGTLGSQVNNESECLTLRHKVQIIGP